MMTNNKVGIVGFDETEENHVSGNGKGKKRKKSGGFQLMGLSYPVLKGVLKRGYKVPTPIQRKTIPVALQGKDVVAMARTGSGKTAGFLLPMFEKLKEHSGAGIRALILLPTRELALQTLKFIKELGRFTNLRTIIILGGDPMESQFSSVHGNPDIIVATPGRLLHICVEMQLKLNNIEYVVFDEADRLFEMGFSEQLTEILHRVTKDRQTLLFSATLPKVLVQFAKAGLHDPVLIRLDTESKIPDTLELNFFYCRPEEREATLLCLLKHLVKKDSMTIVFAATKHHVEYLHAILLHSGILNTYVYSDLDASARKINTAKFQAGEVKVLIVTDVAARGIDIPQIDYVINFNFPAKPKLFVHRVGRCARAGRKGEALSLVTADELCYLLDLHLFLGRSLKMVYDDEKIDSTKDGYFGRVPQTLIEEEMSTLMIWGDNSSEVVPLKKLCNNAFKNYIKSRPGASRESFKRAKNIDIEKMRIHPLFPNFYSVESEKFAFLNRIKNYKSRNVKNLKIKSFQGNENYIKYSPDDFNYEKGLNVNDIQARASGAVLDLIGDSSDMMRTQKKIEKKWDPTKKKYVAENNKEKMIKSESGQWIPVSYKSDRYKKWQERNKIINEEENDDDTNDFQKPTSSYSMRLDTHWGKHNLKMYEKQQKPLLNINLEHILKQRKIKEKRRARNGRKLKKDKIKKKSAKFNKI
ncbi:hypothetical protein PGB90_002163 [Kerria lacca]